MAYVEIDSDLNLSLARLLIIIQSSTAGSKEESILTLDRLVIYEFLTRNPILLIKLLRQMEKKIKLEAKEYEAGGLSAKYFNKSSIYKFDDIRHLIQLLFSRKLISISLLTKDQITIFASEKGKEFCLELYSDYYRRIVEIGTAIRGLNSTSIIQLRTQINLLINV